MKTYEIHPAAKLMPLPSEEEKQALELDIKTYGQKEKVTLLDGKILDGRTRQEICIKLGIELLVQDQEFHSNGQSPEDFVLSMGLRRNITKGQRACMGICHYEAIRSQVAVTRKWHNKYTPKDKLVLDREHRSAHQLAKRVGCSASMISYAYTLYSQDKKAFDRCFKGITNVVQAYDEFRRLHPEKYKPVAPRYIPKAEREASPYGNRGDFKIKDGMLRTFRGNKGDFTIPQERVINESELPTTFESIDVIERMDAKLQAQGWDLMMSREVNGWHAKYIKRDPACKARPCSPHIRHAIVSAAMEVLN